MKTEDFINIVNSLDCEEFSDIPEDNVEFVTSRINEIWDITDSYSTAMNIYKCEDGYVGVRGICHLDDSFFKRNPDELIKLPHCHAVKVELKLVPTFVEY